MGADSHAAIPGADASLPHCLTPEQVMAGKPVGERVIVVDGDGHFTGLAMAELLVGQGKQVTVVTDAAGVAEYTAYTMELGNSKRMMLEKKIQAGEIMYGVNTGIGEFSEVVLDDDQIQDFQKYLQPHHNK